MKETTLRTMVRGFFWRIIVFLTTMTITYCLTGQVKSGLAVAAIEFVFKLFLYIRFEKWFYKNIKYGIVMGKPTVRRSLLKGLCWRIFATVVSSFLVLITSGDSHSAGTFAIVAFPLKLAMYVTYEQLWKRVKWGLKVEQTATKNSFCSINCSGWTNKTNVIKY
jgi:uncharacterized membrane protein